jgi:hypothetical protein
VLALHPEDFLLLAALGGKVLDEELVVAIGQSHLCRVPLALRVRAPCAAGDNRLVTGRRPGLDLPSSVGIGVIAEPVNVERADVTVLVLIVLVVCTADDLDRAAVVFVSAGV